MIKVIIEYDTYFDFRLVQQASQRFDSYEIGLTTIARWNCAGSRYMYVIKSSERIFEMA